MRLREGDGDLGPGGRMRRRGREGHVCFVGVNILHFGPSNVTANNSASVGSLCPVLI